MSQIFIGLSVWLHSLATIILIGHFLLLSLLYLPALAPKNVSVLSEISKRSRVWLYLSLLIFMITGTYLTFIDPNYLGFGNFGNLWGVLMLIKHILVLGMLAIGFWFNAVLRVGPMMNSNHESAGAVGRFRLYVNMMAISGIVILLLTALAQVD